MSAAKDDGIAIDVSSVSYRYSKSAPEVLTDVSFTVPRGRAVGLLGESGSGKSTLGRLIVNERPPTSGSIHIFGKTWNDIGPRSPERRAVQMIFQDAFAALNPYLTPVTAVAEAAGVSDGLSRKDARTRAGELLEEVGLTGPVIERSPVSLSGGQRQRVVIARALACRPTIIVADEPTSALDISVQAQILNLLLRMQTERNLTLLLISHDIAVVNHLTEQVVVLDGGQVVETGDTEKVLSAPNHPYTQTLVSSFADPATVDRHALS